MLRTRLRAENGQTLVLFIMLLMGLVVLFAFVVDVGAWLGTKHRLQSVADSAALAAVQSGDIGQVDNGWAKLSADVPLDPTNPPDIVTVTATHDAPIIFAGIAGISGFSENVTATAQAVPASTLANPPFPNSAYITPIVVNKCIFTGTCFGSAPLSDCFAAGCRLNLDVNDRANSLFGIAQISAATVRMNTFRRWMMCSRCAPGPIVVDSTPAPLTTGTSGTQALRGMNATVGKTLILPVFDSANSTAYHIVGFSAFVVTTTNFADPPGPSDPPGTDSWQAQPANASCGSDCKVITGYFLRNYTLPPSLTDTRNAGSAEDFGVRAIGLTN